jgi:hypothetical protein
VVEREREGGKDLGCTVRIHFSVEVWRRLELDKIAIP